MWTGPQIARWMGEQLGRAIHPERRLGVSQANGLLPPSSPATSPQRPIQREPGGVQARAPRTGPTDSADLSSCERRELWAMDEHRVGLGPIIRRAWARRGRRPVIRVQQRYEWLYLYGFVHPESGESQWLLLGSREHRGFQHCPCPLCTRGWRWSRSAHHPGGKTLAGWHESGEVSIPKGIHLVFLPPYSPELQRMSNDCGRSPMKRLPIVVSRLSTNYKSRKLKSVLPFRTIRSVFSSTRSSIGGLSALGDLLSLVG
jgi:hypothetical protein